MEKKRDGDKGCREVEERVIGKLEHQVKWRSWCGWRSCRRDLKGKFIEDEKKWSEMFGGPARGGAVLSVDAKVQDGSLGRRQ